jgi:hypothetical protein
VPVATIVVRHAAVSVADAATQQGQLVETARYVAAIHGHSQIAQLLERVHDDLERRAAGSDLVQLRLRQRLGRVANESLHELVVMLCGRLPVDLADLEVQGCIPSVPSLIAMLIEQIQEMQ